MGSLDTKARGLGVTTKGWGTSDLGCCNCSVSLSLSHFCPALLSTLPGINTLKTNTQQCTRIRMILTWKAEHRRVLLHEHFTPKEIVSLKLDSSGFAQGPPGQKLCTIHSSLKQDCQVILWQSHRDLKLSALQTPLPLFRLPRHWFIFLKDSLRLLEFQEKSP